MFLAELTRRWDGDDHPFLVRGDARIRFKDLISKEPPGVQAIGAGDAVAIIGDFDHQSIATLLHAIDRCAIIVPLSPQTRAQHEYFLDAAGIDVVIDGGVATRRTHAFRHDYYDRLRAECHGGLVLFSTGTTGRPKAICHDLDTFLSRFATPRPCRCSRGCVCTRPCCKPRGWTQLRASPPGASSRSRARRGPRCLLISSC